MTTVADGLYQYGGVPVTPGVPVIGGPPVGNVFFVQTTTGVDAGTGKSPSAPYKTLAYAITRATANNGDVIYLMPGSTVTVSDATSQPLNVAGITIIGLGSGSNRPLFDFTTANTATIPVSANNIVVQNCQFKADFLSIAAAFTVASALNFTLDSNLFFDASSVLDFLNIVKTTGIANTADGLTFTNNTWNGLGTTSVNSAILSANDIDKAVWSNNTIVLARTATAPSLATITAGVLTNLTCIGNNTSTLQTATTTGALVGVTGTTGTGLFGYNFAATLQATSASDLLVTAGHKFGFVQNFTAGAADKSGILVPAAFS